MPTVSAHSLSTMIDKCVSLGVTRPELIALIPGGEAVLVVVTDMLDGKLLMDVIAYTSRVTGIKDVSFRLGQMVNVSTLNDAGKLLPLSPTLGYAAQMISLYHRLAHKFGTTVKSEEQGYVCFDWVPNYADHELYNDAAILILIGYVPGSHWLSNAQLPYRIIIDFAFEPCFDPEEFEAKYGCSVNFNCEKTRIMIPKAMAQKQLETSDPYLFDLLRGRVDQVMAQIGDEADLVSRVLASIRMQLKDGAPLIDVTAQIIGLSARQIRGALAAQGTSFRKLVEKNRKETCQLYMSQGLQFSQISQKLGYHDQPAFSRAFKGWYGVNPLKYEM